MRGFYGLTGVVGLGTPSVTYGLGVGSGVPQPFPVIPLTVLPIPCFGGINIRRTTVNPGLIFLGPQAPAPAAPSILATSSKLFLQIAPSPVVDESPPEPELKVTASRAEITTGVLEPAPPEPPTVVSTVKSAGKIQVTIRKK